MSKTEEQIGEIKSAVEQAKTRLTHMFPSGENSGAEEIWDCLEVIEETADLIKKEVQEVEIELENVTKQKDDLYNELYELKKN